MGDKRQHAQLSKESGEKAIDSFPRRYVICMLASSTTPCALHGNTTSLQVHVTKVRQSQTVRRVLFI